ncbi:MAG: PhoH family protein [Planctomycetaceae bacterium]
MLSRRSWRSRRSRTSAGGACRGCSSSSTRRRTWTPHEIKTIITRAGEGTKTVFTGDIRQIDHLTLDARRTTDHLIHRMQGQLAVRARYALRRVERSVLAELAADLL